jgi:REP element-mobilizing transposase RayT
MPCYLFTYHSFGSWMPDHPRGYVRRHVGVLPQDRHMAKIYRREAQHDEVLFNEEIQPVAINTIRTAVSDIDCRLHFVATEPTHIHVLVSWNGGRTWQRNRNSIKKSVTIALKNQFRDRPWFSEGASRKRVRDRRHFNYLLTKYLPAHGGWKWCDQRGLFK